MAGLSKALSVSLRTVDLFRGNEEMALRGDGTEL